MSKVQFSCSIGTTDALIPLGLEIWIDHNQIYNNSHAVEEKLCCEFQDTPGEHEVRFVLKNKLSEHTTVNDAGQIVKDARLKINHIEIDDIDINQLFIDHAVYQHNFNGTQDPVEERFYGEMGCNGTVILKYQSPIHLWLLDHL
jgi:hypothetical protein